MKTIILSVLLGMMQQFAVAQVNHHEVVGKNLTTSGEITAFSRSFPSPIYRYKQDSTDQRIVLYLRGTDKSGKYLDHTGYVLVYDLKENLELWAKEFDFNNQETIIESNRFLLHGTETSIIDYCLGNELQKIKASIYLTCQSNTIAVGFKGIKPSLNGYNIKTGKKIWSREMKRECTAEWFSLNDSTTLFVADGLYAVNHNTGKGWKYEANTYKNDYPETISTGRKGYFGGGLICVPFGQMNSYFYFPGKDAYILTGVCSNTIIDENVIFFADNQKVAALDIDGNEKWQYQLPKEITSSSEIFVIGDTLYMVNHGFGRQGYSKPYGKPFIAAFNKTNGTKHYLVELQLKKDEMIHRLHIDEMKRFHLIFPDRISYHSMTDGSPIAEIKINTEADGELTGIIAHSYYFKNGENYTPKSPTDHENHYYYTSKKQIIKMNPSSKIKTHIDESSVYNCLLKTDGYRFMRAINSKETFVIDNQDKEVARLDLHDILYRYNDKIVAIKENKLILIDLYNIIPKKEN